MGQSLSSTQDGVYGSLCFLPGANAHPYKASFPHTGTHQSTHCPPQPRPRAAAPACLGTLRLRGSKDDQVWECCSITFTMCVAVAGSALAAKPQAGSGWSGSSWDPHAPPRPLLHSPHRKEKHPWELEINGTRHSCCANSRFRAIFWKESRSRDF